MRLLLKVFGIIDLLQKSDTRQKIYFLADNSSRLKPTNNSIFSPLKRTFAIRQRLQSLTVQVFLQEV
jgi:type I site-specific restriction endonuclease